MIFSIIYNWKK